MPDYEHAAFVPAHGGRHDTRGPASRNRYSAHQTGAHSRSESSLRSQLGESDRVEDSLGRSRAPSARGSRTAACDTGDRAADCRGSARRDVRKTSGAPRVARGRRTVRTWPSFACPSISSSRSAASVLLSRSAPQRLVAGVHPQRAVGVHSASCIIRDASPGGRILPRSR